jgi:DnaJ-class molecular chaperone
VTELMFDSQEISQSGLKQPCRSCGGHSTLKVYCRACNGTGIRADKRPPKPPEPDLEHG